MPAGSQKQNLTSFIEDKTVLDMKALSVLCQQHKDQLTETDLRALIMPKLFAH